MSGAGKQQQEKQVSRKPKEGRIPQPEEAQRDVTPTQPETQVVERLSGQPGTQRLRQTTLLQMQRKLGNAYVQRLLAKQQSKSPSDTPAHGVSDPASLEVEDRERNGRGLPDNLNGQNGSSPGERAQRQEESPGDEPTEAEKKAAKQRAKIAAGQASQTAQQGQESAAESKNQKKNSSQAKQAANATKKQADSAAKSKQSSPGKKKPSADGPVKQKGPAKQTGPGGAVAEMEPAPNGAGPDQKAPSSPDEDPGFKQVTGKAKQVAEGEKSHEPAEKKAEQAQKAAEQPPQEQSARAQANIVAEIAAAETPGFDKAAFKAQLMQRIQAMAPSTASEADNFKGSGKLNSLKGDMKGKLSQEKKAAQGPIEQKTKEPPDPSSVPPKLTEPAPPLQVGPMPANMGAEPATPKKKSTSEVEKPLKQDSQKLDQQMQEADITEEQLANSNEPEFSSALKQKKEAQTHAKEGPKAYRESEQAEISSAQTEAAATAQDKTQGMHDQRAQVMEQVGSQQGDAKSKDEGARAQVSAEMQKIYDGTKTKVESFLEGMDGKVEQAFDTGAEAAKRTFENFVDSKMTAYKEDRYGGWFGWAKWAKDKLLGMPSEVNAFYTQGRQQYLQKMDAVIDHVVEIIGKDLAEAKAEVARGRQAIQDYLAQLPEDLQEVGAEAAQTIQSNFDELEQGVDNKQNELIDTLANKYSQNLQAIDARIDDLKAANRGLVDKVVDAVKGVINTILELKNMLLGVLSRVADVVGKIIKAPVQFLGNLLGAVKQGFNNFVGNIATHLKKGFMGWLTGAMGDADIELPESFDLKGMFSLVMQILGLTFDKLRQRISGTLGFDPFAFYDQIMGVVAIYQEEGLPGLAKAGLSHLLGPEKLEALMEVVGIIDLVRTGDFGALFGIVQEKLAGLKDMVFEKIQEYLIERVIKSAVTWLIGLFNPVGAFIKAAKMIYDVVMFFIERGKQIMELVNAIISSVGAIVSGNISGAAAMVENALAKAIPVAISFLASLLGLGGISKNVREIVEAVRGKVESALDAVFNSKPVQVVGGFIKKVVGKVKNVAAAGVGKVKNLAAAGASKVKGAAKAGVGKVKGAMGIGEEESAAAASSASATATTTGAGAGITTTKPETEGNSQSTDESNRSALVKEKARRKVAAQAHRPLTDRQAAVASLQSIEAELKTEGLKSLKIKPHKEKPGQFDVIAEASPSDKVGEIELDGAGGEQGPYGLQKLDPDKAGIAGAWLKQRPPNSGGGSVTVYRGFARNAAKYTSNVLREQDVGSGGYLTRDPAGAHDAVYNRYGREPELKGKNQGGVVALTIPGALWDALVDNNHISERSYPGYSGKLSSSELRVNSQEARQLINSCAKELLAPDPAHDHRAPTPEDLLKLLG